MVQKEKSELCGQIQDNIEDLIAKKKKEGLTQAKQAQEIGIKKALELILEKEK